MPRLNDSVGLRRVTAGVGLIGFPLAGLVSSLLGSNEGTETPAPELYAIVDESSTMFASGLVFMLSAALTVPAMCGMMHLLRGRGATLGHLGGLFLLLGALGHLGYGTWQVMLSQVPHEAARAAMIAYLDRAAVITAVLLPLLVSIVLGLLLLTIGLHRAGRVPSWVLWCVVALTVFDLAANSVEIDTKLVPLLAWGLASIPLIAIGLIVLRMPDQEWSAALADRPQGTRGQAMAITSSGGSGRD